MADENPGEPPVPQPPQAVPGWGPVLEIPSFKTIDPPFRNSGKIAIDPNKVAAFPPDVKFCQDGYRERWSNGEAQEVSFCVDVPWGQLAYVRQWFLGYSVAAPFSEGNGGGISREIPFQVPRAGYEHLYCSGFDVLAAEGYVCQDPDAVIRDGTGTPILQNPEPVEGSQGAVQGEPIRAPWPAWADRSTATDGNAKCRVTCTPRPYLVKSDVALEQAYAKVGGNFPAEMLRYVSRSVTPAIQSLPLPLASDGKGALTFADNSGDIPATGQYLLMYTAQLNLTWHQVPSPPWQVLPLIVGLVNQGTFDVGNYLGQPWPKGTLLCQAPPRWRQYRQCTGLYAWDVSWSLLFRAQGWNNFPKADGTFAPVVFKGTNNPVFAPGDFNLLFEGEGPVQWD